MAASNPWLPMLPIHGPHRREGWCEMPPDTFTMGDAAGLGVDRVDPQLLARDDRKRAVSLFDENRAPGRTI